MNFKELWSRIAGSSRKLLDPPITPKLPEQRQQVAKEQIDPQDARDSIYYTLRDFIEDHGLACLAQEDTTASLQRSGLFWIHLNEPITRSISDEPGTRYLKTKNLPGLKGLMHLLSNPNNNNKPRLEICAQVLTDSVMECLDIPNPSPFESAPDDFEFLLQSDLRILVISKEEIENKSMDSLMVLEQFLSDAATARHYRERVDIAVHGYADVGWELWEMPQVRDYIQALDEKWPYWLYFLSREGLGLQFISRCFVPPFLSQEAFARAYPQAMEGLFTQRWFPAMNQVAEWAGLEDKDINALTDSAVEYIFTGPVGPQ